MADCDVLHLKVKSLKPARILELDVDRNGTVDTLKEEITKLTGLGPDEQRLIFSGKVLKAGAPLTQYPLKDGVTLHLVPRKKAASAASSGAGGAAPVDEAPAGSGASASAAPAGSGASASAAPAGSGASAGAANVQQTLNEALASLNQTIQSVLPGASISANVVSPHGVQTMHVQGSGAGSGGQGGTGSAVHPQEPPPLGPARTVLQQLHQQLAITDAMVTSVETRTNVTAPIPQLESRDDLVAVLAELVGTLNAHQARITALSQNLAGALTSAAESTDPTAVANAQSLAHMMAPSYVQTSRLYNQLAVLCRSLAAAGDDAYLNIRQGPARVNHIHIARHQQQQQQQQQQQPTQVQAQTQAQPTQAQPAQAQPAQAQAQGQQQNPVGDILNMVGSLIGNLDGATVGQTVMTAAANGALQGGAGGALAQIINQTLSGLTGQPGDTSDSDGEEGVEVTSAAAAAAAAAAPEPMWPPPTRNLTDFVFSNFLGRPANMRRALAIANGTGSVQELYPEVRELFASQIPTGRAGSAAAIDELAGSFVAGSVLGDDELPSAVRAAFATTAPPVQPIVQATMTQYLKLFLRRLLLGSLDATDASDSPFEDMASRMLSVYIGALFAKLTPHLRPGVGGAEALINVEFLTGRPNCLPLLAPLSGVLTRVVRSQYHAYQDLSSTAGTSRSAPSRTSASAQASAPAPAPAPTSAPAPIPATAVTSLSPDQIASIRSAMMADTAALATAPPRRFSDAYLDGTTPHTRQDIAPTPSTADLD